MATKRSEQVGSEVTLNEALELTYRARWAHARDGGKCLYSQAKHAMAYVLTHMPAGCWADNTRASEITSEAITKATARWYAQGLAPATITKRLNCLSAMGVNVEGHRPPKSRALKWWLTDAEKARALRWLRDADFNDRDNYTACEAMANHIEWTTLTGLRVEETLRLTEGSFEWPFPRAGSRPTAVIVPGLKTSTSQSTLPLGAEAQAAAKALLVSHRFTDYTALEATWRKLREAMGWPKEATLKGLRRTAARYLHVDCGMPLDMVRQYLRHENIATTMEYLRLTGGYGTEEMRRYLK